MSIDPHFRDHDPILDANHCERCNAALRHTLILLADMDLGPKDATALAKKIREIALGLDEKRNWIWDVSRPIEDVVAPEFSEIDADTCPRHPWTTNERCVLCHDADIDIPLPAR